MDSCSIILTKQPYRNSYVTKRYLRPWIGARSRADILILPRYPKLAMAATASDNDASDTSQPREC